MALSFDLSGLPLLETEIAVLVAQQAASPSSFTGGQNFSTTFGAAKSGVVLPAPGSMTTSALIQRLRALLALAETLPQ